MNSRGGAKGTPLQLSFALGTSYRFSPALRKNLTESGFGDGTIWGIHLLVEESVSSLWSAQVVLWMLSLRRVRR